MVEKPNVIEYAHSRTRLAGESAYGIAAVSIAALSGFWFLLPPVLGAVKHDRIGKASSFLSITLALMAYRQGRRSRTLARIALVLGSLLLAAFFLLPSL